MKNFLRHLQKIFFSFGLCALAFGSPQLWSFEETGAVGLSGATAYHMSGLEKRASMEARLLFLNVFENIAMDLRGISILRTGKPAFGLGASVRYYFLAPMFNEEVSESGFTMGVGGGSYYYLGSSRYKLDPFGELAAGYMLTTGDSFALLLESSLGIFPFWLRSEYLEGESFFNRLRPRLGASLSMLWGW